MDILTILFIFQIIFTTLFGIVIGSFLNVVIYRIPEGRTVVKGHSMCMTCGHTLHAIDLIPIISWASLHGKCRYCGAPIASRYTKIESFTGIVFFIFALLNRRVSLFPLIDYIYISDRPELILSFINYCLFLLMMAGLISSMMIYYDKSRLYYGFPLFIISGAVLTLIGQMVVSKNINHLITFAIGACIATISILIIWIISRITGISYTRSELWFDMTFISAFVFFQSKIMPFISPVTYMTIVSVFYIAIRCILNKTQAKRYIGIISVVSIVILSILGYFIRQI